MEVCLREEYNQSVNNENKRAISAISDMAQLFGVQVFLIGGVVRDIILQNPVKDIDITVQGNAIEFAEFLKRKINCEIINIQEDLKTAKIQFKSGTVIDLASTREEKYLEPGALPVAYNFGCELVHDVKRRDFTINTLALRLTGGGKYNLVDYFEGFDDIKNKKIKILHDNSFVDDPSRIIRALKFKVRLGFYIEQHTSDLMQEYLENVNKSMPLSRIKSELNQYFSIDNDDIYSYLLKSNAYKLICENPLLEVNIKNLEDVKEFNLYNNEDIGFIYFSALVFNSDINSERLALNNTEKKIINEVKKLMETQTDWDNPVGIYYALSGLQSLSLAIYYLISKNSAVIRYLKELKDIKVTITGDDLISVGINPSPLFAEILDSILKEKILGKLTTKEEEINFAKEYIKIKEGV
ncbi:hypothetical protein II906_11225 [bacterium]|nr:hypothetical protein [bacterium]